jgi:hypothetical protein
MRCHAAVGLLIVLGVPSLVQAAWAPPPGFMRTPNSFIGDDAFDTSAFAIAPDSKVAVGTTNFSGGANIKVYSDAAAAQAHAAPIRTFTSPTYKAWGDLTFADNDTLLFSENGDLDTAFSGSVSGGAVAPLAANGAVPNAGGIIKVGGNVYVAAASGPGTNALYKLSGGVANAVISNVGTGYFGGIATDSAGNFLLTDTNDPTFSGNAGILRRYSSAFATLTPISLAGGNGSGAYDVALDSEGDAFVTTGSTLTQIAHGTTTASQFGSAFTGFPFVTNLDYVGTGFEPNSGTGKLFVNAVFSDDGTVFGITPIPEPATALCVTLLTVPIALKRRRFVAGAAVACVFATLFSTTPARAAQFFASKVIATEPGTQQQIGFTDPALALGGPRGGGTDSASTDVYNLGNGGSLTLGFDTPTSVGVITNGPGFDFIVSENAFYKNGDPTQSFAELMWVDVSSDGTNFSRFPAFSDTPQSVGPFGTIDPGDAIFFAGARPVLANVAENTIDPFNRLTAGGDAFDLTWLAGDPFVEQGLVDLNHIRFVRLADVIGDGSQLDGLGRPIFDPTGPGIGGADVDAVSVINGTHLPEPTVLPLAGFAVLLFRRG